MRLVTIDDCEVEITAVKSTRDPDDIYSHNEDRCRDIKRAINVGNIWMWSDIKVTVSFDSVSANREIEACSFLSKADFEYSAAFGCMKQQAFEDVLKSLRKTEKHLVPQGFVKYSVHMENLEREKHRALSSTTEEAAAKSNVPAEQKNYWTLLYESAHRDRQRFVEAEKSFRETNQGAKDYLLYRERSHVAEHLDNLLRYVKDVDSMEDMGKIQKFAYFLYARTVLNPSAASDTSGLIQGFAFALNHNLLIR